MADVIDLTPLHADVSRSLAFRARKLLQEDHLTELVPELPPLTLYLSIKEVGLDEAAPLLMAASAEQRQSLVDIACWPEQEFDADELDAWLSPFAEAGPEALASAFLSLDPEIQVLFLQQSLRIIDHRALGDVHHDQGDVEAAALAEVPEGKNHVKTPDEHFTLVDLSEEREVAPFALLDALFGEPEGVGEAYRLLTAARTELPSPLTEEALRFRQARLSDLGFCSPEESARLFARAPTPPPRKAAAKRVHEPGTLPPSIAMALRQQDALFCTALGDVHDHPTLMALEFEWLALVNHALVGYGFRIADAAAIAETAAIVRDVLSLGLYAVLTDSERPERLGALVTQQPLLYFFQRGIDYVRPMCEQARRAKEAESVKAWLDETPAPEAGTPEGLARRFLLGLASTRPLQQGHNASAPDARGFWRSPKEVEAASDMLQTLLQRVEATG